MTRFGLLHTSDAHVAVFDRLAGLQNSAVELVHEVRPELLHIAATQGLTDEVVKGINAALQSLAESGCAAISCTCSTLGEVVENRVVNNIRVQRIDRAAADELVSFDRVLVLAAIQSAGEAADKLLERSALALKSGCRWLIVHVPGAWQLFESGQTSAYEQCVADFANQFTGDYDAVFLSQASMLGAAAHCHHPNVITSPESGLKRLLGDIEPD